MLDLVFTLIPLRIPAVASVVNAFDGLPILPGEPLEGKAELNQT
jgi:hypothetical protein